MMKKPSVFTLFLTTMAGLTLFACQKSELPTATPVENDIPLPTATVVEESYSTDIPHPTLSLSLQNELLDHLQDNSGCELPCFLGIVPGQTPWSEARRFLEAYSTNRPIQLDEVGSSEERKLYTAGFEVNNTTPELSMYLNVIADKEDIVEGLVFTAEIYGPGGLPDYTDKHLYRYSLKETFQRIGLPDQIYFNLDPTMTYNMHVVYEKKKIVLVFPGRAEEGGARLYKVCPNIGDNQISALRIGLASPSDSTDVKTLIGYPFWENTPRLEEVTGMTINDFYQLMISDEQPACFEINKK